MEIRLTLIADYACHTGEGPLWHPDEQALYWVDIPPGRLFRYDPVSGRHEQVLEVGEAIGGFTIQANGDLLLFMAHGRIALWREGRPLQTVIDQIAEEVEGRFNDVIADPEGRVFCGTMPIHDRPGKLYRLDPDGSLHTVLEDAGLSNGMGFTADLRTFYHSDSLRRTIRAFDYDRATGTLSNPRLIVQETDPARGIPDGMAVDAGNFLWSARWDGHCLVHHMPDGRELQRIPFPVPKVSSVTFGGPDYTDMYVTTAGGHMKEQEGPHAGSLFRLNLGVQGKPPFRSRIEA